MNVAQILDQPFRHIARGCRVHAFRSADGKYILKTLTTNAEIIEWFASDGVRLTDLPWASALGTDDDARCEAIQRLGLASADIAWRHLREETALIHVATAATGEGWPVVEMGPDWPPFRPEAAPFMLQHHAELTGPLLREHMARGDLLAAQGVLDDAISLVLRFARRRIASETLNFLNNWGYVGNRFVQVDVGEFVVSSELVLAQAATQRILHSKSARRLRRDYPPLADYLAEQVQARLRPSVIEAMWREKAER